MNETILKAREMLSDFCVDLPTKSETDKGMILATCEALIDLLEEVDHDRDAA